MASFFSWLAMANIWASWLNLRVEIHVVRLAIVFAGLGVLPKSFVEKVVDVLGSANESEP